MSWNSLLQCIATQYKHATFGHLHLRAHAGAKYASHLGSYFWRGPCHACHDVLKVILWKLLKRLYG